MILMAVIVKGQRYLGLKFLKYFKVQNMHKSRRARNTDSKGTDKEYKEYFLSPLYGERKCTSRYNLHEVKIYCVKGIAA